MSILPLQTQASTSSSSSSAPSPNPNSQHGNPLPSYPSPSFSPLSPQLHAFGSLHISDFQSPPDPHNPGPSTPATEDSGGPSEKVTESGSSSGMKTSSRQNSRTHPRSHSGRRSIGPSQSGGRTTGTVSSPITQQNSGYVNTHGSTPSAGRKTQMVNGNYLLNFHYDPISRSQPRGPPAPPPARRQRKRKPYNKDLFLQANYKFTVLDSGNYSPGSMDPDKMLQWEDIICVRYLTPFPIQCPICLERPLCPQITSCGHIFCFPCILQYLLMGEEDHRGDCWKRCPLCFVMISAKDLYTIHITNVKQYRIGDNIEFTFLTRKKDSFTLSHKNIQEADITSCGNDDLFDPFSKFTFTSDVDLSVRQAISDLDGWLARADSGLVDDLEKLPYVCAAMEQLKQRQKYWNEHRVCDSDKSARFIDCGHHAPSTAVNAMDNDDETRSNGSGISSTDFHDQSKGIILDKSIAGDCPDQTLDVEKVLLEQEMNLSSSYEEKNDIQRHSNDVGDAKESDSYNFYQAADGQHLILHTLNMKCLLHHYGSYDKLPYRISGRILQLETVTQSEAMRRRYRFLSHFPLTTTFQLCEIDMSEILPPEALAPFMDEIKKRANQRKQLAKKERKEKIKAEAVSTYSHPIPTCYQLASRDDAPTFSMNDFEALGTSAMSSSPPVIGERKLFSNVTRLGFAAGHDSPSLQIQETSGLHNNNVITDSSGATGLRSVETPSYSNVTSRAESKMSLNAPKPNDLGKKGKKPSRVLLSTAGGRRY